MSDIGEALHAAMARALAFEQECDELRADLAAMTAERDQLRAQRDEALDMLAKMTDERDSREVCWSCPDCAFTFAAGHALVDGSMLCPVCNEERLRKERDAYHAALTKISAIRDSIVGGQFFNWSEHVYPLVATLKEVGFEGAGYVVARANLGTLIEQTKAAEAERDAYKAVAVASLALRVTESTDVPGESIAEIESNVPAARARTARALTRWRNAIDTARAAGLDLEGE